MVLFLRSIFTQLFLNAYFIYRIRKNKTIPSFLKWTLYLLFGIEIVIYFIGFFGRNYIPFESFALIQKTTIFWTLFSLYWVVFLSVFNFIFYLNKKWIFYIRFKDKTIRLFEVITFVSFFTFIGLNLHTSKDNYVEPQIREFSVQLHATQNDTTKTPSEYKILVVSDLHIGYIIDKKVLQKEVDFVNALQADIIVINGDLIDYYLEPLKDQKMDEVLSRLTAPEGVYFVPGNHEYKIDEEADFEWIRQTGITILRDSVVNIDSQLQLIGRDDRKNKENRISWDELADKTDSSKARLLFSHQPNDINEAVKYNFPLIVCGHTHNGQIFPFNWSGVLFHANQYGLKKEDNSYTYTTSGLGLSGFPLRICSKSEVAIFNIKISNTHN